jgi:putative molybdopterin biosynthesis protein
MPSPLRNQLAPLRAHLGWSQERTASFAGISRQAYAAIEAGRSVPSTEVALRLAHAFGEPVDTLFHLADPGVETGIRVPAALPMHRRGRVRLTRLGGVRHGWPLHHAPMGTPADGIGEPLPEGQIAVQSFAHRPPEPDLVVVGCDPSFALVAERLRRDRGLEVLHFEAPSRLALDTLARGAAHLAGIHLPAPDGEGYNAPWVRTLLPFPATRFRYAEWEQVLAVEGGNPLGIRSVTDLAQGGIRFINRGLGSGTRALVEAELARAGISAETIPGFADTAAHRHGDVAAAIASGTASAGVAIRAVVEAHGLTPLPLRTEPYELVIPDHLLEFPAVEALLQLLRTPGLHREIEALGGYDTTGMGRPA